LTTQRNKRLIDLSKPASTLCIDASTNSLAFSYFENGKLIRYGKIRFVGTDAFYKAGDACKKAIPFFKKIKADVLVIESAIYSNSPKTAIQLSLVQGAIVASAQVAGIKRVISVSPVQWQNHIGTKLLTAEEKQDIIKKNPGKSNSWYKGKQREARKNKTMQSVNKNFNIKVTDDDVADAIGIGWFVNDRWNVLFDA
jgi:Holliday junction resolvasome RuvABC endonuclease subunit